jgi:Uma2 family endonuclease
MSANAATISRTVAPPQIEDFAVKPPSRLGDPTWEMALFYPRQGEWTEEQYLELDTNHLVELSDGCLEFLPMPDLFHQGIVQYLWEVLKTFVVAGSLGEVFIAPVRVRLWPEKIREPDVMFFKRERILDRRQPPHGADLAMEVVSEGAENRKRDLKTKREEYARAGILEYWIIDPEEMRITVLTLDGPSYREHGVFGPGAAATSVLLPGFTVPVDAVFAAGEGK